ncbi:F-box protein [Diplonema papillatum]|nr:F-box protein [Diplonema papillatum]
MGLIGLLFFAATSAPGCTYSGEYRCETAEQIRDEVDAQWAALKAENSPLGALRYEARYEALAAELQRLIDGGFIEPPMPQWAEIDRVHTDDLSTKTFATQYQQAGIPLVIDGLLNVVTGGAGRAWDRKHWVRECGGATVIPHDYTRGSSEWAFHTPRAPVTFKEFVERGRDENWYIINFSLALKCPHTLKRYGVPKYFVKDLLQKISNTAGRFIKDSWPCLNVGLSNSTKTGLHTDGMSTHFWMTLLHGEKEWYIFDRSEVALLRRPDSSLFRDVEVWNLEEEMKNRPLLRLLRGKKTLLRPGETIFVAADLPHAVRNRKPNFALSSNYVAVDNAELAAVFAENNVDDDENLLAPALREVAGKRQRTFRDRHLEWWEFKAWPSSDTITAPYLHAVKLSKCPTEIYSETEVRERGLPWVCAFTWSALGWEIPRGDSASGRAGEL